MTWLEGNTLKEKIFPTADRLTYDEALHICKTPKRFLKYIRDHKDEYFKKGVFDKVESSLQYITDFIYGNKFCYSDYLDMIKEYFDEILPLGENGEVELWRGLRLKEESDVNWDDIGNCWTYDYDSAVEFLDYFTDDKEGKKFIVSATTDPDNVDWILSICLNLTHVNEKELRVYDVNRLDDLYIESVDDDY